MPLARISLVKGKTPEFRRKVGDVIHSAMMETIDAAPLDASYVPAETAVA